MPGDTNANGDIFGGWVLSQMDQAGGIAAAERAQGRVVTIAIEAMTFIRPVKVGDVLMRLYRGRPRRTDVDQDPYRGLGATLSHPSPGKGHRRDVHLRRGGRRGSAEAGHRRADESVSERGNFSA